MEQPGEWNVVVHLIEDKLRLAYYCMLDKPPQYATFPVNANLTSSLIHLLTLSSSL